MSNEVTRWEPGQFGSATMEQLTEAIAQAVYDKLQADKLQPAREAEFRRPTLLEQAQERVDIAAEQLELSSARLRWLQDHPEIEEAYELMWQHGLRMEFW